MKFKKKLKIEANIPTTSIADIVFLLLVFFIVSTTFVTQPAINIKLPQAATKETQPTESIIVFLTKENKLFVNDQEVKGFEALQPMVKSKMIASRDKLVVIKADRDVVFGRVVKAMDIAKQAGAQKLAIATEVIEEEKK